MALNIGINVREVDGRAAPSIQAAPTSIPGFVVLTQRGPRESVRWITSWRQFTDHFGTFFEDADGAHCVRGFFDNGGTAAYVTRVVADDAVPARRDFEGESTTLTVTAGRRGEEDPGAWGDRLAVRIRDNEEESGTFDLLVRHGDQVVETWEELDLTAGTGPEDEINDEFTGSTYVTLSVATTGDQGPSNPASTDGREDADDGFVALDEGTDGANVTPARLEEALERFETEPIQLLCCPESSDAKLVEAALTFCADRGDVTFVGHTPRASEAAKAYGYGLRDDKSYGALYFPWIRVSDPGNGRRWIPPTGHVLGVYARTARERGVWKAPAGNAARLRGALEVEEHITDVVHTALVKHGGVNAVRAIPGQGIVVDSSRTLSTNPLWLYVNVRLLFNFVKSSLEEGLRWVVQEPNDETLWNKVRFNTVTPFLMGLWSRGAFGPGAPEDVFDVKCDEDTNPPEAIQQGRFSVEVYLYPSRPAETVLLTIGQQEGGGSSNES